ncbi:MAG: 50S ribosome-binding GTPase [Lachnospiraceae bacterium]|nr:50S ribosome-binding GTPase [Lachnospiraceae bacterium]MBP3567915.1 50S ribosome-binding GTPase [Lachnospiraceae bacterium]
MKKDFYEALEQDIVGLGLAEEEKSKLLKHIMQLKAQKLNIMVVGGTGCGKSSTINALFDAPVAKVGERPDPETMTIEKYELDNLILWDTPGLGDGKEADKKHAKNIIDKLVEKDSDGKALIDLVLVILDGSSRDMGTSFELINNVIIPNLGEEQKERILVAINKADMAKPRHWDYNKNEPDEILKEFLEEKIKSVKKRIKESTGVDVNPIYYCAGDMDDGEQRKAYNLTKLLCWMIKATPTEKRIVYANNMNQQPEIWVDDDEIMDYGQEIRKDIWGSVTEGAGVGGAIGEAIGTIFHCGPIGRAVGTAVGAVVGFFCGIFG